VPVDPLDEVVGLAERSGIALDKDSVPARPEISVAVSAYSDRAAAPGACR